MGELSQITNFFKTLKNKITGKQTKRFVLALISSVPYIGNFVNSWNSKNNDDLAEKQKKNVEEMAKREEHANFIKSIIRDKFIKENNTEQIINDSFKECLIEIFIYSYSYKAELEKIGVSLKPNERIDLTREYPKFLESIGFIRVGGKAGKNFIIDKTILIREFKNIEKFKEFLLHNFSSTREKEIDLLEKFARDQKQDSSYKITPEERDKLLPYHFLIKDIILTKSSFGKLNNSFYLFTESKNNDKLLELLKDSIDYKKVVKSFKSNNGTRSAKDLIEENLTLSVIINRCDKIPEQSKKAMKEKYENHTLDIFIEKTNKDKYDKIIEKEIRIYRKYLKEFNIII